MRSALRGISDLKFEIALNLQRDLTANSREFTRNWHRGTEVTEAEVLTTDFTDNTDGVHDNNGRQLSRASVWSAPACWRFFGSRVVESVSSVFPDGHLIKAGGTAPARSFQTGISTPNASRNSGAFRNAHIAPWV